FRFALISTEFSAHVSNENGFVAGPQMNAIEARNGDMMGELVAAGPLFSPSAFWHALNEDNRRMLVEEGLANFKRTVSNNYFNWLITDHKSAPFRHAFRQWLRRPDLLPMLTRLGETRHLRVNTAEGLIRLDRNSAPYLSALRLLHLDDHERA